MSSRNTEFATDTKVTGGLTNLPQKTQNMDDISNKKKEQIKALIEKMKKEGKPIDWAVAVLC